jgi:hypothetical protein
MDVWRSASAAAPSPAEPGPSGPQLSRTNCSASARSAKTLPRFDPSIMHCYIDPEDRDLKRSVHNLFQANPELLPSVEEGLSKGGAYAKRSPMHSSCELGAVRGLLSPTEQAVCQVSSTAPPAPSSLMRPLPIPMALRATSSAGPALAACAPQGKAPYASSRHLARNSPAPIWVGAIHPPDLRSPRPSQLGYMHCSAFQETVLVGPPSPHHTNCCCLIRASQRGSSPAAQGARLASIRTPCFLP